MYCPNCGNQIQNTSKYCSNCGIEIHSSKRIETPKKKKSIGRIIFIGLIYIIGVYVFVRLVSPFVFNKQTDNSSTNFSKVEAFSVAESLVKQTLKAPSTAKFCKVTEAQCSYNQTTDRWTVKGWVDSQNSFGAMIRSNFTVVFQPVKNENGDIGGIHGSVTFD